jgi:HPt (histidine-containing phosphotransfer) domain-containing protein
MIVERIESELMGLVPRFLDNARMDLEEVVKALSVKDLKALSRLGHSLKGAGAGFGFNALADIGKRLEEAAKASDLAAIDALILAFESYLATVRVEPVSRTSNPTSPPSR